MPRSLPPLGELEAFEATARLGTVSAAAQELSLTQGAVSRKIIELEGRLGRSLFDRVRKRLVLSSTGGSYLSAIRLHLNALDDATEALKRHDPMWGKLHVATLPTFGATWLAPRVGDFLHSNPGLEVTLSTRSSPFDFSAERIDAAIHYGLPIWPGADAALIAHERAIVAVSPTFAAKSVIELQDLRQVPIIHISTRPLAWQEWFVTTNHRADDYRIGLRVENFAMAIAAARSNVGAIVVPSFMIEAELASGQLVAIRGSETRSLSAYYLVVPNTKTVAWEVAAFSDWLLARARIEMPEQVI